MMRRSGSVHLSPYNMTYRFGCLLLTLSENEGGGGEREAVSGAERLGLSKVTGVIIR